MSSDNSYSKFPVPGNIRRFHIYICESVKFPHTDFPVNTIRCKSMSAATTCPFIPKSHKPKRVLQFMTDKIFIMHSHSHSKDRLQRMGKLLCGPFSVCLASLPPAVKISMKRFQIFTNKSKIFKSGHILRTENRQFSLFCKYFFLSKQNRPQIHLNLIPHSHFQRLYRTGYSLSPVLLVSPASA